MIAVLLAGGLGTRMREETNFKPKPMIEIGGEPILWHIMRNLSIFGITDFIVASGYRHEYIDEYFGNHGAWRTHEMGPLGITFAGTGDQEHWRVTVAFTGDLTDTGGRVSRLRDLIGDAPFFVTYGDGLANVDIAGLLKFHETSQGLATLTAVQPTSRFGLMEIDEDGRVSHFREKPKMQDWVSIGYFVFEPQVFDYLDDDCKLEEHGLARLAADGRLRAFRHEGFWLPMDTYREYKVLEELWESGERPWVVAQ